MIFVFNILVPLPYAFLQCITYLVSDLLYLEILTIKVGMGFIDYSNNTITHTSQHGPLIALSIHENIMLCMYIDN